MNDFFSTVSEYWRGGGILMFPLTIAAFLVWWQYLRLRQRFISAMQTPNDFATMLLQNWQKRRNVKQTIEWLKNFSGSCASIAKSTFRGSLENRGAGRAFHQAVLEETSWMRYHLCVLTALVAATPLLGLLGTVLGMIQTFDAVALRSGETTAMVSAGISQALITTQVGLIAALPGAFGLAHLLRMQRNLEHEIELLHSQLRLIFGRENML